MTAAKSTMLSKKPAMEGKKPPKSLPHALLTSAVPIDPDSVGDRWTVQDIDRLARLIALIAMGQAIHAAKIIGELAPAFPALTDDALIIAAKQQLRINGTTEDHRNASRWRRDGFLFEAISWIAARQQSSPRTYLKDPHIKSTTQGIDGLMIEMEADAPKVSRATIFEDKCSDNPRAIFRDDVMKSFEDHHNHARAPELVSIAASLIAKSGINETAAVEAAARVLDLAYRPYLASLAITAEDDSQERRASLFKGYGDLKGIEAEQRVGATFVIDDDLRGWLDKLADRAMVVLDNFKKGAI
jgi:hypothetical protein